MKGEILICVKNYKLKDNFMSFTLGKKYKIVSVADDHRDGIITGQEKLYQLYDDNLNLRWIQMDSKYFVTIEKYRNSNLNKLLKPSIFSKIKSIFFLYIFLILRISYVNAQQIKQPVNILYFFGERKDKVYFTWEVESNLKYLTYIIQASNDSKTFEDALTYKTERKSFNTSLLLNYTYFRLKILTSKDCYIYSDVIYVKNDEPIKIKPDPYGSSTIFIISREHGYCYIYNKENEIMLSQDIIEGHNQICYNLPKGEYNIKVWTENNYQEIKMWVK